MKIGIITLPLHTNIGGILQAYALQTVLRDFGHDVETINLKLITDFDWIFLLKRFILKYIFVKKELDLNIKKKQEFIFLQRTQNTSKFIRKYIKIRNVSAYNIIKSKDYDVIVVGSDQIWRPKYYLNLYDAYLDFAKRWKINRIAYAVSFGTDKWEYTEEQTMKCSNLVKLFRAVSVRESSGVKLCKDKLGVISKQVLDPTMLISKDIYTKLIPKEYLSKNKKRLMYYVLDETKEKRDLCEQLCVKLGLIVDDKSIETENMDVPVEQRIQISVEEWLSGFVNSNFVFTDSFHGTVFSIIFNKPFAVYINEKRGSARFKSLLKLFRLEERVINSNSNIELIIDSAIDWDSVNYILKEQKDSSLNYLLSNL